MKPFDQETLDVLREGVCPFCGRGPYVAVAQHISKAHGLPADQLREELGLNRNACLVLPELHSRLSRIATARLEDESYRESLVKRADDARKFRVKGTKVRAQGRHAFRVRQEEHADMYASNIAKAQDVSASLPRSEAQKRHYAELGTISKAWRAQHEEQARETAIRNLGVLSRPGEKNPMAKLTQKQVDEIRASTMTTKQIMAQYGISRTHTKRLRRGEGWPSRQTDESPDDRSRD